MGVKDLWPMLESVKKAKLFSEMSGETVAVDLSMWIVDSNCVKQMAGAVTRPHLRNLFFRTSNLLQAGILPVFVIEGEAPELKWQTMADRQQLRQGKPAGGKPVKATARKANRSHFKTVIKECCDMLDYLGVPYIQSRGEAEATAAALNAHGLVDAVITEDGDAFLYGARTVYKNFTTTKTPGVDSYSMADIEENLHISRSHMIAVGLLIGCDYSPKGVPGVGKAQVLKVCAELSTDQILERLCTWAKSGLVGDESLSEKPVAQKIRKMGKTLFPEIIAEFMNKRQRLPTSINPWKKPLLSRAQDFNHSKMEWPINYSLEKMLPLLTLYSLSCVEKGIMSANKLSIRPKRIMKQRVRHGVPCLEILWQIDDPYQIDEEDDKSVDLITIENMDLIQKCYPDVVQAFIDAKSAKTKSKKPKKTRAEPQSQPTPTKQAAVADNTGLTSPLGEISNMMGNLSVAAKLCASEETVGESFSEFDVANLSKSQVYSPEPLLNEYKHQFEYKAAESSDIESTAKDDLSSRLDISSHVRSRNVAMQDSVIELSDYSLSPAPYCHKTDHRQCEKEEDFTSSLQLSPSSKDFSSFMEDVASPSCLPKNELIGCTPETSTNRNSVKSKRRDSLDDLLADISDQLKTPARSTLTHKQHRTPLSALDMNSPNPYLGNDSILTGYVTPTLNERTTAVTFDFTSGNENSLLNVANDSITKLSVTKATQSCLANSTVSLFDVRTLDNFSDSDLSLFDVQPSIQESLVSKSLRHRQSNTPHSQHAQSVTKSTPLDTATKNMTYGNFDIVPQLSAFSFNE